MCRFLATGGGVGSECVGSPVRCRESSRSLCCFFVCVCSTCRGDGSWKVRYGGAARSPALAAGGKLHPSCKDHPHPALSLKCWLGCVGGNMAPSTQLLSTERHQYETHLLLLLLLLLVVSEKCTKLPDA